MHKTAVKGLDFRFVVVIDLGLMATEVIQVYVIGVK